MPPSPRTLGLGRSILFIRGGTGTGGFLEGGADEQLSDITDLSTSQFNHAWGELGVLLESEGFSISQLIEEGQPIDWASVDLAQFSVVVLGSNNADYGPAAADEIEAYVRSGGGLMVISDANWGTNWGDAPSSDQTFLDRFGLIMNQDSGQYRLSRADGDFVVGGTDFGMHPILIGPDGLLGTADDVNTFEGEGVSPITVTSSLPAGVTAVVLAKAEGMIHVNDSQNSGSFRPADLNDGALVVARVGDGLLAGHFDRNTFFNFNGAGTSLNRFDNARYALNLFHWLAGPTVRNFGSPKVNSQGMQVELETTQEASAFLGQFPLSIHAAIPDSLSVLAFSPDFATQPFMGGFLLVGAGFSTVSAVVTDVQGNASFSFPVPFEMAGSTGYFQVLYRDNNDPFGLSLTDGVRVSFVP